ncbi:hypothetical protein ACUN24_06240 [Pedobacter sp. WC2501]|uniref:hypothetical protein n=1 Tax=Pedobacter sp. WC2501 TaxID=3461400 RepID=UPI0040455A44
MKKFQLLAALSLILTSVLFFSCKKDEVSGSNQSADSSWNFGAYTYTRGTSSQAASSTGDFIAIAVTTTGNGGNYGAYSGSALTFTICKNLGAGEYTFADLNTVVSNPTAKYIYADCTIGTAVNTGAILYGVTGPTTVKATITIDAEGKYYITSSNAVVLTKKAVVGNGIAGAADTYSLTIKNAY